MSRICSAAVLCFADKTKKLYYEDQLGCSSFSASKTSVLLFIWCHRGLRTRASVLSLAVLLEKGLQTSEMGDAVGSLG